MENINKNKNPLISIIMPVYNAGDFLMEAIESIINQTYKNWELIAVDDCSNDKSWQILRKYQKNDKRIRIFKLKKHKGLAYALNFAIKKAKGKYLARMDADDISHPERLEKQISFLEKNKDIILVGTQVKMIDENKEFIGNKNFPPDHKSIYEKIFEFMPVQHATILTYTKILKEIKYQNHTTAEDVTLFFKLLNKGKLANLNEYLYKYRIHNDSNSLKNPKKTFFLTLKSRIKAVFFLNYKPSIKSVFINIFQLILIIILPNKLIINLYKIIRIKKSYLMHLPKINLNKTLRLTFGLK